MPANMGLPSSLGIRCSTVRAYLTGITARKNHAILTDYALGASPMLSIMQTSF
jgi:hypothetical protein